MSIHPDMDCWKRRFAGCLAASIGALLLIGARDVTHEWRFHGRKVAENEAQMQHWAWEAVGRPGDLALRRLTEVHAEFLLRACAAAPARD